MSRESSFLAKPALARLFTVLEEEGYTVVGPTVDQDAIVYAELTNVDELPIGWSDDQQPGRYRLTETGEPTYFGFAVGPHSWKSYFFPPQSTLSEATHTRNGWVFKEAEYEAPKLALLGVRACELAAIAMQDRIFAAGDYVDPVYQKRRENALLIAVNCTSAAATCFCTSTDTGPRCESGYDIALTEVVDGFVLETGSDRGREIVEQLSAELATTVHAEAAESARARAVDQIERRLDTDGIRDLLLSNLEHPRWDHAAERCLSCTNCTMVCPTCFCSSVEEVSDLSGDRVERRRQWDSCFNWDFSYINGGNVRDSIRARYRQWLTHKLASWIDQFGQSGCVGCGRCITWCPVGIDLTEEVAAIREDTA